MSVTATEVAAPQPRLTPEERRELVQQHAASSYRRRVLASRAYMAGIAVMLVGAFIPLVGILWTVFGRAAPYLNWHFLTTTEHTPSGIFPPESLDVGGISNLITGTILSVGIAVVIAVPIGILVGTALYEGRGRLLRALRIVLEMFVGMPSLLFAVFITLTLFKTIGLCVLAGSLALAFVMLPLVAVSTDDALRSVPDLLTEAGLALGARRSRVMRRVVLPSARPRILTGCLLALSRAVGETAPVVFLIGSSPTSGPNATINWNPLAQGSSLTSGMFNNFQNGDPALVHEVWGIAAVLIVGVLVINLGSRIIVARANKGQN